VITYLMPVVALVLGVGLLREQLTNGAVAGLLLIGLGAWLATSHQPLNTSTVAVPHPGPGRSQGNPPPRPGVFAGAKQQRR
jgi:disulfide bond formation protein DsbB